MTTATDGPGLTTGPSVAPVEPPDGDDIVGTLPAATDLSPRWLLAGLAAVAVATVVGIATGPVSLPLHRVAVELLDHLPFVSLDSGLSDTQRAIVWEIRTPRVVLGLLVGALLAGSGAGYQGVFRNPLADPYLLGIAAGAGLGATLAIVTGAGDGVGAFDAIPMFAFIGALVAVAMAAALSVRRDGSGGPATLILAGVAVAAFFTAAQTYVQQRHAETLRQVYAWILGRLSTSGWDEVLLLLPYALVCGAVLVLAVGALDVLAVGDDEAQALGLHPRRIRMAVLVAASLATAAAVAVSGLIGFVGLVVPHGVRLVAGVSNRRVIPLSFLFGGAFLALADVLARTVQAPAELPIGVITAFVGAPFFLWILRSRSMA
ncbi:iron ABC transporter permease [Acidimicrobiia bacterium EGI L10123]|uniref:FecCD family ABC transporter permease n=1 Tax=Salinilacustrithrix flava TaxID=2957203 RepID=UPI003D7C2680|nr:iron ABC transporter permease [Acidimicrobiia bacterium EGI L10123]